jgi:hypothetical protein
LNPEEQDTALALLEMARQGLAMHTSCAWFFDDIADREAVQVLCSAARAIQIARDRTGTLLEETFTGRLAGIPGNRLQYPDGGTVYRECVLPLVISPDKQAACLALIESTQEGAGVLHADAFSGEFLSYGEFIPAHDLSLLGGAIRYCLLCKGTDAAVLGLCSGAGVSPIELITTLRKEGYASAAERLTTLFPTIISFIEFPPAGQRLVARSQLNRTAKAFNETAGVLFDRYTAMEGAGHDPRSYPLWVTRLAWYVLTCRMEEVLSSPESTAEDLHRLAEAFSTWGVGDTPQMLRSSSGRFITRLMEDWVSFPGDRGRLETVADALSLLRAAGMAYPARDLQDLLIAVRDGPAREWEREAQLGDEEAMAWCEKFQVLGQMLGVSIRGGNVHHPP